MYSISQNAMQIGTDFGVKLENPNIMYLESTHQLLMFSGYANKSYFVGSMDRQKPDVVEWEISKHLEVPNKLRDCGQVLYQDHILIFGGMMANTSYSNTIYMISLREHNYGELTQFKNVQCPSKDKFYALLVGQRIHLFGLWNNVKHHALSTEAIDSQIPAPVVPVVPMASISVLPNSVKALSTLSLQSSAMSGYSNQSNGSLHGSYRTASGYNITDIASAASVHEEEYPDIPPELDVDGQSDEKLDRDPSTRPTRARSSSSAAAAIPPGNPVFQSLQSQIEERDQRILELEQENEALRKLVAQVKCSITLLSSHFQSFCFKISQVTYFLTYLLEHDTFTVFRFKNQGNVWTV